MLLYIAILLGVLWLLGFSFHIAGSLVHIIIVIAVIILVYDLLTKRGKL